MILRIELAAAASGGHSRIERTALTYIQLGAMPGPLPGAPTTHQWVIKIHQSHLGDVQIMYRSLGGHQAELFHHWNIHPILVRPDYTAIGELVQAIGCIELASGRRVIQIHHHQSPIRATI